MEPGVTKALVGYHEAHDSDNWKVVGAPKVDDLRGRAAELGIEGADKLSKTKLVDAIAEAEAAEAHSGPMTEITEQEG